MIIMKTQNNNHVGMILDIQMTLHYIPDNKNNYYT